MRATAGNIHNSHIRRNSRNRNPVGPTDPLDPTVARPRAAVAAAVVAVAAVPRRRPRRLLGKGPFRRAWRQGSRPEPGVLRHPRDQAWRTWLSWRRLENHHHLHRAFARRKRRWEGKESGARRTFAESCRFSCRNLRGTPDDAVLGKKKKNLRVSYIK